MSNDDLIEKVAERARRAFDHAPHLDALWTDVATAAVAAVHAHYADLGGVIDSEIVEVWESPDYDACESAVHRVIARAVATAVAGKDAEIGRLTNADGEHMADLATTIKIQAEQIATLSNQLDYANRGKAELEAEVARLRSIVDEVRSMAADDGASATWNVDIRDAIDRPMPRGWDALNQDYLRNVARGGE